MKMARRDRRANRGSALVGALFVTLVGSVLLLGTSTFATSSYVRTEVDADYANALNMAEAGINYEMHRIGSSAANADQYPGVTYTQGGGSFKVWVTHKDGTYPWVEPAAPPSELYIISEGTVDGVTRTVKIAARANYNLGNYAIYTMNGTSVFNGSSMDIIGDAGSNGLYDFSGSPNITGQIDFNGPSAGWTGGTPSNYTVNNNPRAMDFPTVDELANAKFPSGGLAWLSTNNSNASAVPPIVSNSITGNVTLVGPGDYYVTNMNLTATKKITMNNTAGPVNIWVGPAGGVGVATFRGGTGAVSATTDPTKVNHIYVATTGGIKLAGNETIDASIYAYNKSAFGVQYGHVLNSGNPIVNGQVIANTAALDGNITFNYVNSVQKPDVVTGYRFDGVWVETNPR